MLAAWRRQRYDHSQKVVSARLGGLALWKRYRADRDFRVALDTKLSASRARGGAISLRNLGEEGFKLRLEKHGFKQVRPVYRDNLGNKLRSAPEVKVANELIEGGIRFVSEPRVVVGNHAFYPDFGICGKERVIEVVGYVGDDYWDRTALKIQLMVRAFPRMGVAVVTSFLGIMRRRLAGTPRVACFSPYQVDQLLQWCRGSAGVQPVPEGRVAKCASLESS